MPYWILALFVLIKLVMLWKKKDELIRRGKAVKEYKDGERERERNV